MAVCQATLALAAFATPPFFGMELGPGFRHSHRNSAFRLLKSLFCPRELGATDANVLGVCFDLLAGLPVAPNTARRSRDEPGAYGLRRLNVGRDADLHRRRYIITHPLTLQPLELIDRPVEL